MSRPGLLLRIFAFLVAPWAHPRSAVTLWRQHALGVCDHFEYTSTPQPKRCPFGEDES